MCCGVEAQTKDLSWQIQGCNVGVSVAI